MRKDLEKLDDVLYWEEEDAGCCGRALSETEERVTQAQRQLWYSVQRMKLLQGDGTSVAWIRVKQGRIFFWVRIDDPEHLRLLHLWLPSECRKRQLKLSSELMQMYESLASPWMDFPYVFKHGHHRHMQHRHMNRHMGCSIDICSRYATPAEYAPPGIPEGAFYPPYCPPSGFDKPDDELTTSDLFEPTAIANAHPGLVRGPRDREPLAVTAEKAAEAAARQVRLAFDPQSLRILVTNRVSAVEKKLLLHWNADYHDLFVAVRSAFDGPTRGTPVSMQLWDASNLEPVYFLPYIRLTRIWQDRKLLVYFKALPTN